MSLTSKQTAIKSGVRDTDRIGWRRKEEPGATEQVQMDWQTLKALIEDELVGGGGVDPVNSPMAGEVAVFTDGTTIEGLTEAEFKAALSLEIGEDVQAHDAVLDGTEESFTTVLKDKLDAIAAGATLGATWGTNIGGQPSVVSQAEAEAGDAITERIWTAQRVGQAIAALVGAVTFTGFPGEESLVASTTQTQGQGPLTEMFNVVATVANAGDVRTAKASAPVFWPLLVVNKGANAMSLYPASGDDLGAGAGTNGLVTIDPDDFYLGIKISATLWLHVSGAVDDGT